MKLFLILFIYSISLNAFSRQQVEQENWDLDLELFDGTEIVKTPRKGPKKVLTNTELRELEKIDFKNIDALKSYERFFERIRKETLEKRKKFRWPTHPYMAVLREDSIIYNVNSESEEGHIVFRKAYVWAEEKSKGGNTIWIFDKNGKKRYRTSAINVISIENDLDMEERPMTYNEYDKPVGFRSEDKFLRLDNYINLHYEYMTDEYLDDLFSSLLPANKVLQENYFEAYATRFEYKVFYKWRIPIEFGVNFNYQEGSWQGLASGLIWRSLFFGPVAQYSFRKRKDSEWNVQMSYQKSILFQARSLTDNFSFNYSTNALELNLNYIMKTRIGKWVLGGTYRRARASLKKSTVELTRSSERGVMQSWSILLGFNFDIKWKI